MWLIFFLITKVLLYTLKLDSAINLTNKKFFFESTRNNYIIFHEYNIVYYNVPSNVYDIRVQREF